VIVEKPPVKSGFSRVVEKLSSYMVELGHVSDVVSASDLGFYRVGELKITYGLLLKTGDLVRRMHRYDVINIHGNTPFFSEIVLFLCLLKRLPVVYTFHCPVDFCVRPLKPLSTLYNLFLTALFRRVDAVVTSTRANLKYIRGARLVYVIPWGVDEMFTGPPKNPPPPLKVLFVGQMRPYKGVTNLLKAAKILNEVSFHLVGDGPYSRRYAKMAERMGLCNVIFHGTINDGELKRMYNDAHVLVLPSVAENEAFGLVGLEAASAGCLVVASNLPGLQESLGDFAILVPPGDVRRLCEILTNLSHREGFQQNVRRIKMFKADSWRDVVKKYVEVYRTVIRRRKNA